MDVATGEQGGQLPPKNFTLHLQIISVDRHFGQRFMYIVPRYITLLPKKYFLPLQMIWKKW